MKVIIEVKNGIAYLVKKSKGVEVIIKDLDVKDCETDAETYSAREEVDLEGWGQ